MALEGPCGKAEGTGLFLPGYTVRHSPWLWWQRGVSWWRRLWRGASEVNDRCGSHGRGGIEGPLDISAKGTEDIYRRAKEGRHGNSGIASRDASSIYHLDRLSSGRHSPGCLCASNGSRPGRSAQDSEQDAKEGGHPQSGHHWGAPGARSWLHHRYDYHYHHVARL